MCKRVTAILLAAGLAAAAAAAQAPAAEPGGPASAAESSPFDPTGDAALERRLTATFAQFEELAGVEVEVRAGVVRLSGEVVDSDARELAGRLAEKIDASAVVDNRITEVRDLPRRLHPALAKLRDRARDLLAALPLLAVALLVFLAAVYAARWLTRRERPFRRLSSNPFVSELARQALKAAVLLVGALLALDLLDATALVSAVLGTAGLAGLAVGFAFRDLAENYIASILLSLRQPFAPDDAVRIEGYEGKVVRLTSRATILMTFDGNHVRIPNAAVFKGILVNYTRNPQRRFDFTVGVGTGEDLAEALRRGLETLQAIDGVLADPAPTATLDGLGDSSVTLHLYAWVDQRQASLLKVKGEAIRRVKEAFEVAGISMPVPTYQVRQLPAEAAPPQPTTAPGAPLDISPDTDVDRQIAAERAEAGEVDLLRPGAPQE